MFLADSFLGSYKFSREGVIFEWPLIVLLNDARDIILTSRTNIRQLADHDNDNVKLLGNVFNR